MKFGRFRFILILAVLAFLEAGSIPFDLVLVAMSCWAFLRSGQEVLPEALIVGLFLDLLTKFSLGANALILVLTTLLVLTVKERFLASRTQLSEPTFWLAIPFLLIPLAASIIVYQPLLGFLDHGRFTIHVQLIGLAGDLILAVIFYPFLSFLSLKWRPDQAIQLDFRKKI